MPELTSLARTTANPRSWTSPPLQTTPYSPADKCWLLFSRHEQLWWKNGSDTDDADCVTERTKQAFVIWNKSYFGCFTASVLNKGSAVRSLHLPPTHKINFWTPSKPIPMAHGEGDLPSSPQWHQLTPAVCKGSLNVNVYTNAFRTKQSHNSVFFRENKASSKTSAELYLSVLPPSRRWTYIHSCCSLAAGEVGKSERGRKSRGKSAQETRLHLHS